MQVNTIICGAMPEATKGFPNGSFNCCISSPPYWALRDYGVDGQLGLEKTFEEYIDKLCTIFDEVKRVLRDDGTCWVNLGDTYGGSTVSQGYSDKSTLVGYTGEHTKGRQMAKADNIKQSKNGTIAKSLCLIPQRFAIEMVNRGWILRNVIIWHKPNPMPSSAKDRFTVDFEYVYFFVKSRKYWFEPQYEPYNYDGRHDTILKPTDKYPGGRTPQKMEREPMERWPCPLGRNKRTCWEMSREEWLEWCDSMWVQAAENGAIWKIPTQSFAEAHFATFPEKLVEPMIKAGCPEFVCTKCGKAREKLWDIQYEKIGKGTVGGRGRFSPEDTSGFTGKPSMRKIPIELGYTDCGCNAEFRPGIMLEPFCGSGTALQVAARLRRDWVGVELKPEYIEMAEKRAGQGETGISVKEQRVGQLALFGEAK